MSIRTIEAPGVEIKEIDKSAYTPAMTGTRCFVMGYSDKGEPYQPMQFTSKSAWQNYYGDPDNEAERYFYNACAEVINQNGVLYSARLPYDNKSRDKMVGFKFKVNTFSLENPTAGQYLSVYPIKSYVDHDDDFEKDALQFVFDNKCYREIDANLSNGYEYDKEIKFFYNSAFKAFKETYDKKEEFRRYAISYLSVDLEKTQELSARFLTFQEAKEYVDNFTGRGVKGKYQYVTVVGEKPTILRDCGDWIAQPLYCNFVKEAVTTEKYDGIASIKDIDDLVKEISSLPYGDTIPSDKFDKIDDIEDALNEILAKASFGTTDYERISDMLNVLTTTYKKPLDEGVEFPKYGYTNDRVKKLKAEHVEISIIDLYNKHQIEDPRSGATIPDEKWVIPAVYDIQVLNEGANNEWLFDTPVSAIYEDETMNLSANEDVSALYTSELWEEYKGRSLSSIIKTKQDVSFEDYVDFRLRDSSYNISSFQAMREIFKAEGNIKFQDVIDKYNVPKERVHADVPYYRIADLDGQLNNYLTIDPAVMPIMEELSTVDEYRTGESNVPANSFWVFDKTCATLNKVPEDERKGSKRQLIGIFPVITTAANALYAQSMIKVDDEYITDYETVTGAITKSYDETGNLSDCYEFNVQKDLVMKFSQDDRTDDQKKAGQVINTISRMANEYFLPIQMNPALTGVDMENMKKIGVVVVKAYLDASEGNKVSFNIVESFVGSLDKNAKNPNTGVSTFIDRIINTQSDYIYFFSNCFASYASRKEYDEVADFFVCRAGKTGMLGFFENETLETISYPSILQGMDKCFELVSNVNERDIDIVCDAGLANIAQYMKSVYGGGTNPQAYDLTATDEGGNALIKLWKCDSLESVSAWKTVLFKFDNFCKNVRKDCMFIADGPRPFCLTGEKKIIRPSKPTNTIDANILPNVKWMSGLNTNYGAGYCNWFQITDEFTGDEFWCPPSIKAMGVYINTDLNFEYWDAPAGLNRGVVQALDCAFSPTLKQAGPIYQKSWNYAINYPNDGIVLEGQKTFQVKPSCFDRVNVRRLFLRLERQTFKVARYFVYEGNTAYTRQRLIDMLDPIFNQAKIGGGVYDYKIICDESINTPNVIDNNELRVKIGIKPVKTAEYVMIDFIALSTGGSFSEM